MVADRLRIAAGATVFAEGDPPTTAFLIESGRVRVGTHQFGEERVLGELGAGALLGEMAVIDDSPRSATATAIEDCILTPIDRHQFAERLEVADPIVRALLLSQVSRYRSALATLTGDGESGSVAPRPSGEADAFDKIRLESELRGALERAELQVFLQPLFDLTLERVAGYEALVRWHHPERGAVSPAEFIRLAEETSLIVPVGEYVLARVCDMLAELRRRGREPLPFIALNVSARQIEDESLVDRMLARLAAHDLPPDRLEVEITESLVLDSPRVAALIGRCHAAGMHVALDDFGTGYSNLAPLLKLDVDRIKLDQAFVRALDTPRGAALAAAIVGMAHALDCEVVAEGVETVEQRESLRTMGCRYAQGWLIGRPTSLDDVLASG